MELPLFVLKEWTFLLGTLCSLGKIRAHWRFVVIHFHRRPGSIFEWFPFGHHLSEAQTWGHLGLLMVGFCQLCSIEGERSALGDIIITWALNWVVGKRTHEGDE